MLSLGLFGEEKGSRGQRYVLFSHRCNTQDVSEPCVREWQRRRKTAGEVDLADKGQTSHRKLEINGSAGYAPYIHSPANARCCDLMARLTYPGPVMKTRARHTDKHTRRRTETHTNETLPPRYLAGCILGAPQQSPSPSLSSWRMDLGNCQLKWNPICGVERGGHIECSTHTHIIHTHPRMQTQSTVVETSLSFCPETGVDPHAGLHVGNTSNRQHYPWLHLWKLQHD